MIAEEKQPWYTLIVVSIFSATNSIAFGRKRYQNLRQNHPRFCVYPGNSF